MSAPVPPRPRRWRPSPRVWSALNYASAAAIVVLGAFGGAAHGVAQWVLVALAAVVAVVQLIASQRRERAAEDTPTRPAPSRSTPPRTRSPRCWACW